MNSNTKVGCQKVFKVNKKDTSKTKINCCSTGAKKPRIILQNLYSKQLSQITSCIY